MQGTVHRKKTHKHVHMCASPAWRRCSSCCAYMQSSLSISCEARCSRSSTHLEAHSHTLTVSHLVPTSFPFHDQDLQPSMQSHQSLGAFNKQHSNSHACAHHGYTVSLQWGLLRNITISPQHLTVQRHQQSQVLGQLPITKAANGLLHHRPATVCTLLYQLLQVEASTQVIMPRGRQPSNEKQVSVVRKAVTAEHTHGTQEGAGSTHGMQV